VVSTTLTDVDAWQNSVLLAGDAARTVAELKASDGPSSPWSTAWSPAPG
jgi:hypothetical protein